MTPGNSKHRRVYLDLTHLGRHVTGIERISIEQFEKVAFENAEIIPVRSSGVLSMVLRQQLLLPLLALAHPSAHFVFPGFPPSPFFTLIRNRVVLYVHDTFLLTRVQDLSTKARLYMAPQFALAVRHLKNFFVNSEKTRAELSRFTGGDAAIRLYRPAVANIFGLSPNEAMREARPLRLVSLGTVEPRKNYLAAVKILEALRATCDSAAELHIIGRAGWGTDAEEISGSPGVVVHGYLAGPEVKRQLESADVYLCTSHDEGLGLPLLEAQYAGLAVIAPDQDVFREVLAASATFIDPAKPVEAASTIARLLATPDWRAKARGAALANIARWNAVAEGDMGLARRYFVLAASSNDTPADAAVHMR